MVWLVQFMMAMLSLHGALAGMYTKTNVIELTGKNFNREVLRNGNVTVVEFYAPWCGHCKNLQPEYVKSANSLNGIVRVGAVNCDAPGNKQLCAHYGIKGFPTIKVFRPEKKTDRDLRAVVAGEQPEHKPHKIYTYNGPREAKAINKFAVSKLRNYAATLEDENSFLWMRSNGIPRVIMLPGHKYKSKSIAPLFKVLSNEYFGKVRFAYIPRRADGAWNLLGVKAPENSQLAYMADDRGAVVYQGSLSKKNVKAFVDEQYELELARREARGDAPVDPDAAAEGNEWIDEDKQEGELEHLVRRREKADEEMRILEENKRRVRERRERERAEKEGREYVPEPEPETTSAKSAKDPLPLPTGSNAVVDEDDFEEIVEFQGKGDASEEAAVVDDDFADEASIDDADDALEEAETEEEHDAVLDEVEVELTEDEIIDDSPEAIAAWKEKVAARKQAEQERLIRFESRRAKIMAERYARGQEAVDQEATKAAAKEAALPPGITPKPGQAQAQSDGKEEGRIYDTDDLVKVCIRRNLLCVLLSSTQGFKQSDIAVLLHARSHLGAWKEKVVFHYLIDDTDELKENMEELGLSPYPGVRKTNDGVEEHQPRLAMFDFARREYLTMGDDDFTTTNVVTFLSKFILRIKEGRPKAKQIPRKFSLWITEEDLEYLDREEELLAEEEAAKAAGEPDHDEL